MSHSMPAVLAPDGGVTGRRRVLIGTDTYPPDVNGAGNFAHRLAIGLAQRGNEVHVIAVSDSGSPTIHEAEGVTVHRVASWPVVVYPNLRFAMPGVSNAAVRRIVTEVAPDVIHVQSHFGVGRACLRAARQAGIATVATNHFMPEPLLRHIAAPRAVRDFCAARAWKDAARVFAKADHVTTPTARAAEHFVRRGYTGHIEPVSCGIDLRRFQPRSEPAARARAHFGLPDRQTMLFVGRLDDEKHVDHLIGALRQVRNRRDAQLVIAGVGARRDKLEALSEEMGVGSHVHMLGYVTEEDLPRVYHTGDVFTIASVAELQSIVTLEAMASGLPVVGADAVALPHLISHGHNGYLFPPGDVDDIATRVDTVLSSPRARGAMGAASRKLVTEHAHTRSLVRFEAIYDSLAIPLGSVG